MRIFYLIVLFTMCLFIFYLFFFDLPIYDWVIKLNLLNFLLLNFLNTFMRSPSSDPARNIIFSGNSTLRNYPIWIHKQTIEIVRRTECTRVMGLSCGVIYHFLLISCVYFLYRLVLWNFASFFLIWPLWWVKLFLTKMNFWPKKRFQKMGSFLISGNWKMVQNGFNLFFSKICLNNPKLTVIIKKIDDYQWQFLI